MPAAPASPPKRMTRSRAKAVQATVEATKRKSNTTASVSKNTLRNETKKSTHDEDIPGTEVACQGIDRLSTRRPARARAASETAQPAMKSTRSRSLHTKLLNPADTYEKLDHKGETRTHAKADSTKSSSTASKEAPKRKVTFSESTGEDKENIFGTTATRRNATLGRKPSSTVRVATAKRSSRQNGSSTAREPYKPVRSDSKISRDGKSKILSPKKNDQVAKVISAESEDELSGGRTPLKPLSKPPSKPSQLFTHQSPSKISLSTVSQALQGMPAEEDRIDGLDELQDSTVPATSPIRSFHGSIIASPAKRPPHSPFKDAFRSGAKRLAETPSKSDCGLSNWQESMLSKSPIKFNLGLSVRNSSQENSKPNELSTPFLQSPARKLASPLRRAAPSSKITVRSPKVNASSETSIDSTMSSRLPSSPIVKNLSGLMNALPSSGILAKVPKLIPEGQLAISPRQNSKIPVMSPQSAFALTYNPPDVKSGNSSSSFIETTSIAKVDLNEKFHESLPPNNIAKYDIRTLMEPAMPEEDSGDDLQSTERILNFGTPIAAHSMAATNEPHTPGPMTVLAERFMQLQGTTPDQKIIEQRKAENSQFSPVKPEVANTQDSQIINQIISSNDQFVAESEPISEFEEAMAIREDTVNLLSVKQDQDVEDMFRGITMLDYSQEFADENANEIYSNVFDMPHDPTTTCTPARLLNGQPKILHTVSKVPLRPAADEDGSPLKIKPIRRRASMVSVLSPRLDLEVQTPGPLSQLDLSSFPLSAQRNQMQITPPKSNFGIGIWQNQDTAMEHRSAMTTPARTPRPDLNCQLLRGAVVYVDVHTSEGADASGIFVELLGHMGAKCVKQWSWNSRGSARNQEASDGESNKIGITHVVFKDGGKRTMEKVRDTNGVVLCVGVGWVLDCERENKWLDECHYAIDVSTIPRGGHRRRKSMEPKRLSSWNGNLFEPDLCSKSNLSPSKEFLNLDTPRMRRTTVAAATPTAGGEKLSLEPSTPSPSRPVSASFKPDVEPVEFTPKGLIDENAESTFGSPTTPYFLHRDELIQQTCPPKQTNQLFFPLSGEIKDQPDEAVRRRLWLARRRSMQWAPKLSSPLKDAALV